MCLLVMALLEENCTQTVLSQQSFAYRILQIIEIKVTQLLAASVVWG